MRPLDRPGRSPVHARRAMAATSHTAATQTALEIMRSGGNALDAAIAACAVQCVVEPAMTGIGGDCFAMYAPGGRGTPLAFNGSGRAPAGATLEAITAALAETGAAALERGSAHSVIVPGAVDAWTRLHADHGRLPFAELMAPAIGMAREGFPVASRVAFDIGREVDYLRGFERATATYLDASGRAPTVGSLHRLPELADALEAIAREGRSAFYEGELAREMVAELNGRGGLHAMADFADAAGEYVTPISSDFRGLAVHECPPNGQGLIALLLLNMMREVKPDPDGPLSLGRIHLEIEACRLAYRVRDDRLADPAHADVPVAEILAPEHARALLEAIDPERATVPPATPPLPRHRDTVYISVVDEERNACSFINTLYHSFGGGITTRHGITLTNRGQAFSLDPASPNVIAPGKRPRHTIIPAMASGEGRVALCFGVMGGEYQAMGQQQFLTRHLDFGLDVQEAMDLPRFMVDPDTGEVEVESGIDERTREALRAMGHTIVDAESPIGGSQAISIDAETGVLTGGSDPRKDGSAAGF